MKHILHLALLVAAALAPSALFAATCLNVSCAGDKTTYCTPSGTILNFDLPTVSSRVDCGCATNFGITVVSEVSTGACPQRVTRTWKIFNACGEIHFCSQTISVYNLNPPVFQAPPNITRSACGSVAVTYAVTATAACCGGNATVVCTPPSGSTFGPGTTTVNCTATDCCGNTATTSFTVTVQNNDQPVFQGVPAYIVTNGCSGATVFFNVSATSACCGTNVAVNCSPSSGSFFGLGANQVSCTATDCNGHTASTSFYVVVDGGVVIYLSCADKIVPSGSPVTFDPPAIQDPCCPPPYNVTHLPPVTNGACPLSVSQTWVVTDVCGASNYCSQTVTVALPPLLVCASNKTLAGDFSGPGSNAPVFTLLHSFAADYFDGTYPMAGLLLASDGALYGTTEYGGTSTDGTGVKSGTVFKLNTNGDYSVLHDFYAGTDQAYRPAAGLVEGTDGALYGTTQLGALYGTVFKLDKTGSNYMVLHDFTEYAANPLAGLVVGAGGALYGTTQYGGNNGAGSVFTLNEDGSGFTNLYSFSGSDGANPLAGLVIGTGGALFGTTSSGGTNGGTGTVFKLNQDGSGFTSLYSFAYYGTDGQYPLAGLAIGSGGALFGTTSQGGASGNGTVFKLNQDGSGYTNLYSFGGQPDGSAPKAGLAIGSDGTLYGTTYRGGSENDGTIFSLNQDGSGEIVLVSLGNSVNAFLPLAGLVIGPDGTLYGTTEGGGTNSGSGTVFAFKPVFVPTLAFDSPTVLPSCCGGGLTASVVGTVTNSPCSFTRTWQLVDCGGQTEQCSQTITWVNTNAAAPSLVLNCIDLTIPFASPLLTNPPSFYDPFCTDVTLSLLNSVTNGGGLVITQTWQGLDCCSNSATCTRVVTLFSPYSVPWHKVANGGGTLVGGNFALTATIGQHDAGPVGAPMTGGRFGLSAGYWSIFAAVPTPGAPRLTLALTRTNTAMVSWPSPATGWNLQQNNNLSTANWVTPAESVSDNGTIKYIIVNPPSSNRFYRLIQ